jgi:hypothetical protein
MSSENLDENSYFEKYSILVNDSIHVDVNRLFNCLDDLTKNLFVLQQQTEIVSNTKNKSPKSELLFQSLKLSILLIS